MIFSRSTIKTWISFAVMLAGFFLPAFAFAQGGPFDLPNDDLSKKTFLDPLFGPMISGGGESPLTTLMSTFNSALLVVGGILLAYTIVAGTMSTAHDGEMLGKKWSSMWIPIRTSLGVAAVMPVIGGGWCVAQAVVVWLAMQGAGLANSLWDSFIGPDGGSILASASYNPPANIAAVRDAYSAMLINSTCVAAHKARRNSDGADAESMSVAPYDITIEKDAGKLSIYYGRSTNSIVGEIKDSSCGLIMLEEESDAVVGGNESIARGDNSTSSMLLNMAAINRPVIEARQKAFLDAQDQLEALGARVATGEAKQSEVNAKLNQLLTSYSTSVTSAAKTAYAASVDKTFLNTIKRDGWVMAGAFYMQMSKTQDLVTRAITNAPAATTPPKKAFSTDSVDDFFNGIIGGDNDPEIMRAVERARTMSAQANRTQVGGVAAIGTDAMNAENDSSTWVARVVGWFMSKDSAFSQQTEAPDFNENPIIMAKGLGEKMTATAWGALAAATGAQMLAGGGVTGIGPFLAPVFAGIFFALIVPGATMSTYLPMLPYILWLGVVLGWAILLIEAVVAAPLWAIVHLAPDGDGVVGRGGQGYMLVLSLVLRPPLMIIGLVAAFVLMKPIGYLVNSTFIGAFTMGVSPGFFGLTQAIAGCIIYAVLMITIVQRVFSLIHVIPDRLLRWIGGGGGELGQEAGAVDQGVSKSMAMGMQSTQNLANSAQQGIGQGAAQRRANMLNERQLDNQKQDLRRNDKNNVINAEQDLALAISAGDADSPQGQQRVANAYSKLARAHEQATVTSAAADKTQDSKDFTKGFQRAMRKENNGEIGAMDAFIATQTAKATQDRSQGKVLSPFQDHLLGRQEALAEKERYMADSDSVRDQKKSADAQWNAAPASASGMKPENQAPRDNDRPDSSSSVGLSNIVGDSATAQSAASEAKDAADEARSAAADASKGKGSTGGYKPGPTGNPDDQNVP